MKPVNFKQANRVFGVSQEEYANLPALLMPGETGNVTTCWRLSFWERIRVLFLGRIWLTVLSFNKPLQPQWLSTKRKDHFITQEEQKKQDPPKMEVI